MTGPDPQRPPAWVGRATPPPTMAYEQPVEPPRMVVVSVPRRGSGGRTALVAIGIVVAFCALGGTALLLGLGAFNQKPAGSLGNAPPGLRTPVRDGSFQFVVTQASCGHP